MKRFLQLKARFASALLRTTLLVVLLLGVASRASAQSQVTGKVSDTDGLPLIGATVVVSGTTNGVLTDQNGKYVINVPSKESILEIEYLGYAGRKIMVGTKTVIDVILQSDTGCFSHCSRKILPIRPLM